MAENAPVIGGQGEGDNKGGAANALQNAQDTNQAGAAAGAPTPEELMAQLEQAKGQVKNLESLKGKQGSEIGALRAKVTELEKAVRESQTAQQPDSRIGAIKELQQKYENGDIDLDEYTIGVANVNKEMFGSIVDTKLQEFRSEDDQRKYAEQFIKDNPGYVEAFDSGELAEDMAKGFSAEHAWDRYQLRIKFKEIESLKSQIDQKTKAAQDKGVQDGIKIEQGKAAAGKVLSGTDGSPARKSEPKSFKDKGERLNAGVDLLNRLRSG